MASKSTKPQQPRTNFESIESLFYEEFNTAHPILPQWTLERIPSSVNIKRLISDKQKMSNGWLRHQYNTKGQFSCTKCIKRGINAVDATWFSAYITVLFRAYYGPDTDEFGQTWIGGWVQMKIFTQQCQRCDEYITVELDTERHQLIVKWLHKWIASEFHGFPFPRMGYKGNRRTDVPHKTKLCEACQTGLCQGLHISHRGKN